MLVKQKIKYIQSLGQKKFREQEGLFVAEGPRLVKELLEADAASINGIFALADWIDENKILLGKTGYTEISPLELERISQLSTPNKVVAVVKQYETGELPLTKDRIILVLDGIQDPGNLGTIIRIADWFGISQVVCSEDSVDVYNPKVVQSTMGSIARVRIHYTNLEQWLGSQEKINIYAADLEGEDVTAMKKIKEGIIVIGNESKGISNDILNMAGTKITISKKGMAESLNAAVATGIILSHIA